MSFFTMSITVQRSESCVCDTFIVSCSNTYIPIKAIPSSHTCAQVLVLGEVRPTGKGGVLWRGLKGGVNSKLLTSKKIWACNSKSIKRGIFAKKSVFIIKLRWRGKTIAFLGKNVWKMVVVSKNWRKGAKFCFKFQKCYLWFFFFFGRGSGRGLGGGLPGWGWGGE